MDSFAGEALAPESEKQASQARAPEACAARPAFFDFDGERFTPRKPSRSPWNRDATNGVAVAGLLMHLAETVESPAPMVPAHVTIDILRPVPYRALPSRAIVTRPGKKIQMVESYLLDGDEPVARARVLRVREAPSPMLEAPLHLPPPEAASDQPFMHEASPMAALIETRLVGPRGLGFGATWARFRSDLAPGIPIDGVVAAAMVSDFGNGLARVVDRREWSFANVDISLHMVRRPVGEWLLIDGDGQLQGLGVGLSNMRLADRAGTFGRAHQTMFIDRMS